jgi:hypothetical protein
MTKVHNSIIALVLFMFFGLALWIILNPQAFNLCECSLKMEDDSDEAIACFYIYREFAAEELNIDKDQLEWEEVLDVLDDQCQAQIAEAMEEEY